jgi:polysaccharide export outer membrane protein
MKRQFFYRILSTVFPLLLLLLFNSAAVAGDYIIGPGDVLKISVYDNPDLLTVTRVSDTGSIILPLLGQVKVSGLSISQASDKIASLYSDGYLVNPQVSVFVQEFRSKKAVVLGNVNRPGLIELTGPTTFLELISKAGGLAQNFGETATIKRNVNGQDEVISINIKALTRGGDMSQNVPIREGDTIYISQAGMCYVTGEVKEPDAYACDGDATVLKLVTLAGGFTGKASRSGVRIIRVIDGKKTVIDDVEMNTPVQPDDVIVVPESFF